MKYLQKEGGDLRSYFYMKANRQIVPVENTSDQILARDRIMEILADENIHIPVRFREASDKLALYNPKGILEKANALLIEGDDGAYDLGNRLNDLNGKEWTKFTCSWYIFNALKSDLKEEREFLAETEDHPATYSPTMIENFIEFFTKEGMTILDPFAGIGSTLVAARRTNRIGYGIELNKKYFEITRARLPEFRDNIFNQSCEEIPSLYLPEIDFCISSPPYWDVLNRSTKDFKTTRSKKGLDSTYSDKEDDLGNIENYEEFVSRLCKIYENIYQKLANGAYVVIILKNVKKEGVLYPLAWDVAKKLSELYVLKDEKIWIQDKIGLAPYGYPYSWVSNILHHYCLILQKKA
jgi:DNA modification methylase